MRRYHGAMLLDGLFIPLMTPFYPDGRLYVRKLEHNVAHYSLTLASGFLALSEAGETALLTDEERLQVLETVAGAAARDKVLIAAVGLPGVAATLRLADAAARLQYDAVLVAPSTAFSSRLWRAGEPATELMTYFKVVADRCPLPVILSAQSVHGDLPVSTIVELAGHPNVLGVFEQSSHIGRVAEVMKQTAAFRRTLTVTPAFTAVTQRMLHAAPEPSSIGASFVSAETLAGGSALATAPPVPAIRTRTKQAGFQVLWSRCEDAVEAWRAGAVGFAPDLSAAVPQACFELWAAWKDGDAALMAEKGSRVQSAEAALASMGVAGVKVASEGSGYFGGRPRLPLLPLTGHAAEQVRHAMEGMRS